MHFIINTALFVSLFLPRAALQAAEHCLLTQVEVSEVELPNGFDACLGGAH
jgi:hypothetical protein